MRSALRAAADQYLDAGRVLVAKLPNEAEPGGDGGPDPARARSAFKFRNGGNLGADRGRGGYSS